MVNLRLVHVFERCTPACQAGFRPQRNTDEQIATMAQRVADSRRWRSKIAALFTDFSSAYDRVSIPAWLHKLCAVQADPALVGWLKSYLTDRRARGKRNNTVGRSYVLGCGLPQGASPPPLLWNIYIYDLNLSTPKSSTTGPDTSQLGLAEDTSFHTIGNTWPEVFSDLRRVARDLEAYCAKWRLTLNPRKCRLLCLGKQSVSPDEHVITIHGNVVQHTTRYCFLGVWFDSYLTFRYHCEVVAKRIRERNIVLCALAGTSWGARTRVLQRSSAPTWTLRDTTQCLHGET